MESFFEEKEQDGAFVGGGLLWNAEARKPSAASNDHSHRLTYAQAAVFEEARAKAERAALQVRQHRRSSTPPSLPSATTHPKVMASAISAVPSSSSPSSSSPAFSNVNEEFPRRPGAFVCLKFIKGLRHPESGCPFDHPNLSAKDFAYCKRLCSFFPANNCDYRLGHKEKRFAKPDEVTCDFVHEWAYFNDATGQLVRIRPPLPEDIAALVAKEQIASAEQLHAITGNKQQRKGQRARKPRDAHERTSSAERDLHTPTTLSNPAAFVSNSTNNEIDAELVEHAAVSDAFASLSLEEQISSSSSSSPSTTAVSIASTSRSSTISPVNLRHSLSGRSPSASSTPCRFSHSHSSDFDPLPSASSAASAASTSSSIFSFPALAPNAPARSTSDLYSSPVDDFDLQELSTWTPANVNTARTAPANNSSGGDSVSEALSAAPTLQLNEKASSGVSVVGPAGYDAACILSPMPSSGLSPGALWRQLSAEDKELLRQSHHSRFQIQALSSTHLEPPMVLKRPASPPAPLRVPAMYPSKMPGSNAGIVGNPPPLYNSTIANSAVVSSRLPDPFRYLSGEVLHSLKALVNSFYPSRPEELEDFFLRLDVLLARHHVSAAHPILKQLFSKRFPTQDAFVSEVLHRARKLEEARAVSEWGKHLHTNALQETQKNFVVHATSGINARMSNSAAQSVYPIANSHAHSKTNSAVPLPPQAIRTPARASYPLPVPVYLPIAPVAAPPMVNSTSAQTFSGFGNAMFTPAASQQKLSTRRQFNPAPHMQTHASF